MIVIEMNPRVSRSSALASKATGFPIAKIAAKLAVGYTLDEIRNDITRETPASFEPTIDYVVVKVPRFTFEKFPQTDATLTTQMKSVGEAIGHRAHVQGIAAEGVCARWKSARGGLAVESTGEQEAPPRDVIQQKLVTPNDARIFYIRHAMRTGFSNEEIHNLTKIDPWFLAQLRELVDEELALYEFWRREPLQIYPEP